MSDVNALIADLEAATEGSRELSDRVLVALGWEREDWTYTDPEGVKLHIAVDDVPDPTRSVDAALALVPEGWDWAVSTMVRDHLDKPLVHVELADARTGIVTMPGGLLEVEGHHPATTLCAALLRSLEAGDHGR